MSTCELLFQWASTIKIQLSVLLSHQIVSCFYDDTGIQKNVVEKILHCCKAIITHSFTSKGHIHILISYLSVNFAFYCFCLIFSSFFFYFEIISLFKVCWRCNIHTYKANWKKRTCISSNPSNPNCIAYPQVNCHFWTSTKVRFLSCIIWVKIKIFALTSKSLLYFLA